VAGDFLVNLEVVGFRNEWTFFFVWGGGACSTGAVKVKAAFAIAAVFSFGREGTGNELGNQGPV
jgi:hypothetical protein